MGLSLLPIDRMKKRLDNTILMILLIHNTKKQELWRRVDFCKH